MVNPSNNPRVDTRGLPEGYDPHKFYEYRIQQLSETGTGLEGFLCRLLPYEVIRSFAIAIDPFHQFKVAPKQITPANRKRIRSTVSFFDKIVKPWSTTVSHYASAVNYLGVGGLNGPLVFDTPLYYSGFDPSSNPPSGKLMESNDTTRRTRLMGSDDGTLDLFKYVASSPDRVARNSEEQYLRYDASPYGVHGSTGELGYDSIVSFRRDYFNAAQPAAVYPYYAAVELRNHEISVAETLMSKHAVSMFKGVLPTRRDYTLFRNVVELRDIPRGISQLRETFRHLRDRDVFLSKMPRSVREKVTSLSTPLSDIPKEYLSYCFGWRQTYKDVMDLVALPAKVGKKFNLLIARSGKPTTFRSKREILSGGNDVPGFYYEPMYWDSAVSQDTRVSRVSELRMVVNATFDFPPINPVSFRSSEFLRKLGVAPTFTDLYNLVPWTWLFDWFTGLGNYLDIIEEVNNDKSLINYGFITCVSKGNIQTTFKWDDFANTSIDRGLGFVNTVNKIHRTHSSQLDFTFQLRKDLGAVMDVKHITDVSELSVYQQSILGALLAQRTNFRRT